MQIQTNESLNEIYNKTYTFDRKKKLERKAKNATYQKL